MTEAIAEGPQSARLVLVGDALDGRAVEKGRPFVGPMYHQRLRVWWEVCGLPARDAWYLTTLLPFEPTFPDGSKVRRGKGFFGVDLWAIDALPRHEVERHERALHERIATLDDPWLIVAAGDYALHALIGKGRVSWRQRDGHNPVPSIHEWRGSVLEYVDLRGRRIKLIPVIPPGDTFANAQYEKASWYDWERIGCDQHFRDLRVTMSEHRINPSLRDVRDFVREAVAQPAERRFLSVDIETPRAATPVLKKDGTPSKRVKRGGAYIGCVGLAFTPDWSLTVPTTTAYWGNHATLSEVFAELQRLFGEATIEKVGQNFVNFDWYILDATGFEFRGPVVDTRMLHHCYDIRDRHDLAYQASILTRRVYWKDEAKDPDAIARYATTSDALYRYCGMDVCGTLENRHRLVELLTVEDRIWLFNARYLSMGRPLVKTSRWGVAVSASAQKTERDRLESAATEDAARLAELVPALPLVAKKSVSGDRLKWYLYGDKAFTATAADEKKLVGLRAKWPDAVPLDLPLKFKRDKRAGKSKIRCDEVAIRETMIERPEFVPVGETLLSHKRARKLSEFVNETKVCDTDGRARCVLSLTTETLRLAAQSTPFGGGRNLQNIDRSSAVRGCFVPDTETA